MNLNPSAKTVLCFGDSNTWDTVDGMHKRYPISDRWTGVLQYELGEDYSVIEEGLSGRTTIYSDPSEPWKNGNEYLRPCLLTHEPIDVLVIMLGTNDVKNSYGVADADIGKGVATLVETVRKLDLIKQPEILIIAPPVIKEKATEDPRMSDGPRKSTLFAPAYASVADTLHCAFLDAAQIIESGDVDGYHLDRESHHVLGKEVAKKLKSLYRTSG